jgi:Flp pilus assembly protein TadG
MPTFPSRRKRQKGAALIMLTMMLSVVVIPMIGLAIDGGMAYLVQTRLSAACDAAALAGARSLSVGLTLDSQIAAATATINEYLETNYPTGMYRTFNLNVTSNIQQTAYKTRTVSLNATIVMPTLFMSIFNHPTATVAASAQASRRDVNIMLVIDRSSSMATAGVCGTMKAAAQTFADDFTNGRDRLGLITFMATPTLDFPSSLTFKSDAPSLDSVIGEVQCGGNTGSAAALWKAYQQLQAINEPGALNLIVFFTDGVPNGVSANFNVKTQPDQRYGVSNSSTLTGFPASSCKATTITGAVAQEADNNTFGTTGGLFSIQPIPTNVTSQPIQAAAGCAYPSDSSAMRADIAAIPPTDINGNATTGYQPVITYPNGPYVGQIRVDMPPSITQASQNAADNAAIRIRADKTLVPVIYTIGLGGTSFQPLDQTFLLRLANDPRSPIYDPSEPAGLFVFAENATQLNNAFNTVASQILRLSK